MDTSCGLQGVCNREVPLYSNYSRGYIFWWSYEGVVSTCISGKFTWTKSSKSGAVVKPQKVFVVYRTTSNVEGYFKSDAVPFYWSLMTPLRLHEVCHDTLSRIHTAAVRFSYGALYNNVLILGGYICDTCTYLSRMQCSISIRTTFRSHVHSL